MKSEILVNFRERLSDTRFETLWADINNVIQPESLCLKGTIDSKIQACFAVKPSLDGLLDLSRRTYSETMADIQSAFLRPYITRSNNYSPIF
jgi:hypothetical protein